MLDGRSAYRRWLARGLLLAGGAMLPWLYLLARGLPGTTTVSHWSTAWIGLDGAEGLGLLLTGLLLWRGDRRVALPAAATATLLCVDAWFDIVTSSSDSGLALAIAMAVALELPAAAVCARLASRALTPPRRSTLHLLDHRSSATTDTAPRRQAPAPIAQ